VDRNGRAVLAAKAARAFGFGLNSVALGLYLAELGLEASAVGAVLGAALLGTMLLTVVIALRGDRIGRRRLLVVGSLLMMLSALIPLVGASPPILVLIALTGMVGVTSNESTGLHAVDQAVLPGTVPAERRTDAFAAYGVVAFVATAIGSLTVGPLVELGTALGLEGAERYAPAFVTYAIAGLVATLAALALDRGAEVGTPIEGRLGIVRSRGVVGRLSALFALDSFAGGLVVQGFLAYWFATRFGLDPGTIGWLFAAASVFGAISLPIAARLAARFGLIRTMVFTHMPASVLLIGVAVTPVDLPAVAAALYLVRSLLASMDVPTRQSYVMAVVDPAERTATAGITSLARSAAQTAGPLVAGVVLVPIGLGVPLIACGVLKIAYDLALFGAFRSLPAPGERGGPSAAGPPSGLRPGAPTGGA
jgi:MFS family permease